MGEEDKAAHPLPWCQGLGYPKRIPTCPFGSFHPNSTRTEARGDRTAHGRSVGCKTA